MAIRTAPGNGRAYRRMIRLGRSCPRSRRTVASIALGRRGDMGSRLGLGILRMKSAAVTTGAIPGRNGARHVGMHPAHANGDRRKRHAGSMARIAGSRGGNVGRWLAGGACSVMAGGTGTGSDQGMGISGRQPGRGFMT
ncbi:hypothetical protein SCD_n00971 [Sulfuricella denitrificans skB26]|uniref:Uncharacterized protein n=1 Tax=Sulfuricella denitrificans (strain DSM 22764 / NBRC 105220 / skB26) TaxID=1163617 RepID=S6AFV6_SULDS|nr:hypothetical protein SCD_n00971 [Sulfuricella denitrificans skB26]